MNSQIRLTGTYPLAMNIIPFFDTLLLRAPAPPPPALAPISPRQPIKRKARAPPPALAPLLATLNSPSRGSPAFCPNLGQECVTMSQKGGFVAFGTNFAMVVAKGGDKE